MRHEAAHPPYPVRARAAVVGALCVAVLGLLIPYSDLKLQGTWIAACHLPIAVFVIQLVLVLGVNSALRLLAPRLTFTRADLAVIYAMMLVGSGIPSFGLTEYLLPTLAGMRYFATPENKWESTFFELVPDWLAPTDSKAVLSFFEGLHPGESIPWSAWVTPLCAWTGLALVLFAFMGCLSTVFRRQWVEREHLIFPLVQLPLDMLGDGGEGALAASVTVVALVDNEGIDDRGGSLDRRDAVADRLVLQPRAVVRRVVGDDGDGRHSIAVGVGQAQGQGVGPAAGQPAVVGGDSHAGRIDRVTAYEESAPKAACAETECL